MKNWPSGIIVPEDVHWDQVPVFKALKPMIDRSAFRGENIEVLIQTGVGGAFEAFSENQDIPAGAAPAYVKQLIPLREIIANAQLTLQVRNRGIAGDNAWGNAVRVAIEDMFKRFYFGLERATLGAGNGFLARADAVAVVDNGDTLTVSCDNTYDTDGIENVQLIQVGDLIDIYNGSSSTLRDATTVDLPVTAVSFGNRNNSSATVGTVTFTLADDPGISDGDCIYLANSRGIMPMGVMGAVQGASTDDYIAPNAVTTFQNLTRTSYPSLQSVIYQATDFGPSAESPSDGTPCSWDPSVITDAIDVAEDNSNSKIGVLLMHGELAKALDRQNKSFNSVTVNVGSVGAAQQPVVGSQYSRSFEKSDGSIIPIYVCRTLPRNMMHGLAVEKMGWHPDTEFDYLRLYGDIWGPTKDDRKANFEAPYYGAYNLSFERCDCHFTAQDLSTAV